MKLRSDIFKAAWSYYKLGWSKSFGACLKLAWMRHNFIQTLGHEVLTFTYKRIDGSIRKAQGTLQGQEVKNTNPRLVIYYDLEKEALRSFKLDNIVH